eukprot:9487423-Pyramimonas_sp.AAC.1
MRIFSPTRRMVRPSGGVPAPPSLEMNYFHSGENTECLAPSPDPSEFKGTVVSGSANGSVSRIETGVAPSVGHQFVQCTTCSS